MNCESCKYKELAPANDKGTVYIKCGSCGRPLCETQKTRSNDLNKAYFAWLGEIAHELNNNGITLQDVVKQMKALEVVPTKDNLHEILAKPYIEAQYQKTTSTKLDTKEFNQLIDALSLFFAHYYELDIPFSPDMHNLIESYKE